MDKVELETQAELIIVNVCQRDLKTLSDNPEVLAKAIELSQEQGAAALTADIQNIEAMEGYISMYRSMLIEVKDTSSMVNNALYRQIREYEVAIDDIQSKHRGGNKLCIEVG